MMVLLLTIVVLLIDLGIKYYVQSQMTLGVSIPIIEGAFHITYILNPGAAFGILAYQRTLLLIVAVGALAGLLYAYNYVFPEHLLVRVGTSLFSGGAIGNIIDRIQSGYVIDFLDFRVWPVFNSADIAIFSGMCCLIYVLLFTQEKQQNSASAG